MLDEKNSKHNKFGCIYPGMVITKTNVTNVNVLSRVHCKKFQLLSIHKVQVPQSLLKTNDKLMYTRLEPTRKVLMPLAFFAIYSYSSQSWPAYEHWKFAQNDRSLDARTLLSVKWEIGGVRLRSVQYSCMPSANQRHAACFTPDKTMHVCKTTNSK